MKIDPQLNQVADLTDIKVKLAAKAAMDKSQVLDLKALTVSAPARIASLGQKGLVQLIDKLIELLNPKSDSQFQQIIALAKQIRAGLLPGQEIKLADIRKAIEVLRIVPGLISQLEQVIQDISGQKFDSKQVKALKDLLRGLQEWEATTRQQAADGIITLSVPGFSSQPQIKIFLYLEKNNSDKNRQNPFSFSFAIKTNTMGPVEFSGQVVKQTVGMSILTQDKSAAKKLESGQDDLLSKMKEHKLDLKEFSVRVRTSSQSKEYLV